MSRGKNAQSIFEYAPSLEQPSTIRAGLKAMNAVLNPKLYPLIMISGLFLGLYSAGVVYLFTHRVNGRRRRWHPLDFVWVPMGGLTGVLMAAIWWSSH